MYMYSQSLKWIYKSSSKSKKSKRKSKCISRSRSKKNISVRRRKNLRTPAIKYNSTKYESDAWNDDTIVAETLLHKFHQFSNEVYVSNHIKGYFQLYFANNNDDLSQCFSIRLESKEDGISMEIEGIKYPNAINCLIRGSDILVGLFNCARDLHVDYIELIDLSELKFESCSLNLNVFYSLLHGQSWYNKFGYFSVVSKPDNNPRSQKIEDYIRDTPEAKDSAKELCNMLLLLPGNTILDMMAKLYVRIKTERGPDLCKLVLLYNKLRFEKHFDSLPYLRLQVNDDKIEQIYNDYKLLNK
jgi:hypothetical protein